MSTKEKKNILKFESCVYIDGFVQDYIDGLMQDGSIFSALATKILQSHTKPSIYVCKYDTSAANAL